jgi:hypothetical protein
MDSAEKDRRKELDRRRVERRAPKRGVNVRHDDTRPESVKRIMRGKKER